MHDSGLTGIEPMSAQIGGYRASVPRPHVTLRDQAGHLGQPLMAANTGMRTGVRRAGLKVIIFARPSQRHARDPR